MKVRNVKKKTINNCQEEIRAEFSDTRISRTKHTPTQKAGRVRRTRDAFGAINSEYKIL